MKIYFSLLSDCPLCRTKEWASQRVYRSVWNEQWSSGGRRIASGEPKVVIILESN